MKIRWNRTSLRLRITPSELAALARGESVREGLAFDGGVPTDDAGGWNVTVTTAGVDVQTSLRQVGGSVVLALSDADLNLLCEPEREGVYFTRGDPPRRIAYYIEKDFPCAHPRAAEVEALAAAVHGAAAPLEETFALPPGFSPRM